MNKTMLGTKYLILKDIVILDFDFSVRNLFKLAEEATEISELAFLVNIKNLIV